MNLVINLIDRHGWEGLYDIYINHPKGAEIFNIQTGEYIQYYYKDTVGNHKWMYYSSLFAEWFPFSTRSPQNLEFNCLISDIKKYADIWELLECYGGIDAVEDNSRYAYDNQILKYYISEYHKINKLIILREV